MNTYVISGEQLAELEVGAIIPSETSKERCRALCQHIRTEQQIPPLRWRQFPSDELA
jgi:hypothetical protein